MIYRTSDYWLHPLNADSELYCITGIKAQASGCIPVIIPRAALSETVIAGFMAKDESDYGSMLDGALSATDDRLQNVMRKKLLSHHFPTWDDSTTKLLEVINSVI